MRIEITMNAKAKIIAAMAIGGLEPNTIGRGPINITPPKLVLLGKPWRKDIDIMRNPIIISAAPSMSLILSDYMHKL
jgi:hypothetical protein